jgi:hypothetical protein
MSAMRELLPRYGRVLVVSVVLLASIACGDADPENTPAPSAPSVEHRPEVQQAIDELEVNAGFRPLLPTYLPDGLNPTPETAHVRDESQQTAIIAYFALPDSQPAEAPPAVLEITEDPAKNFECPLCPGEAGFTPLELGGEPALAEEGEASAGVVYYVLYFVAGDVFVTLNAEWDAPEGSELVNPTAEMKQELVRVAESIIVQA